MLKIFFRIAIFLPYELHFIFRDQLRDERPSSAFCVPAGATASGHCVE
jgi:hypothetical protein